VKEKKKKAVGQRWIEIGWQRNWSVCGRTLYRISINLVVSHYDSFNHVWSVL